MTTPAIPATPLPQQAQAQVQANRFLHIRRQQLARIVQQAGKA